MTALITSARSYARAFITAHNGYPVPRAQAEKQRRRHAGCTGLTRPYCTGKGSPEAGAS